MQASGARLRRWRVETSAFGAFLSAPPVKSPFCRSKKPHPVSPLRLALRAGYSGRDKGGATPRGVQERLGQDPSSCPVSSFPCGHGGKVILTLYDGDLFIRKAVKPVHQLVNSPVESINLTLESDAVVIDFRLSEGLL